jgi:hypothetical protein
MLYGVLRPTPPGAYIYACKLAKYALFPFHLFLFIYNFSPRPPSWTQTKEGLSVQVKLWSEMVEIWKKVSPEVASIVAV